jgi:hypothetical protein
MDDGGRSRAPGRGAFEAGRDVLPGFQLRLKDWFDKVPREEG